MINDMEIVWTCSKCDGLNVERLESRWVDANTKEYKSDGPDMNEDTWCADCQNHTPLKLRK